jgi:GxxExxY protein
VVVIQRRDTENNGRIAENSCNVLTERVIGAAIDVHRALGPGLLESAYEVCLSRELELRGCRVERQVHIDLVYKDVRVERAYRIDMIIDETLLIEVKAVEDAALVHKFQMLTYLKLASKPLGLIINFNVPILWKGIRRVINSA